MEHAEGSGWTPEGQEKHFAAVEKRGMPHISPAELRNMKRALHAGRRRGTALYNGPDWGLEGAQVTEVRPVKG
jgi:hypothetical protein